MEEVKLYTPDFKKKHDFQITTPDAKGSDFLNSKVGQALSVEFQRLGNNSMRIRWESVIISHPYFNCRASVFTNKLRPDKGAQRCQKIIPS